MGEMGRWADGSRAEAEVASHSGWVWTHVGVPEGGCEGDQRIDALLAGAQRPGCRSVLVNEGGGGRGRGRGRAGRPT